MWGNTVWGRSASENHMGLSMYDGAMETVEYMWVTIWCIQDLLWNLFTNTKLQKFTSLAYSWSTSDECTKWDAVVAGRDGLCENLNPLQG